jgi:hypothetical protein
MTDDQVFLDPQRALGAARNLVHAGDELKEQRTGAGGRIAAASAARPWGKDDIGAAFEKNYRGFETQLLEAWQGVAEYLEGMGYVVAKAVDNTVRTDDESGNRVRGTWKSA